MTILADNDRLSGIINITEDGARLPNSPDFSEIVSGLGWMCLSEQDHYALNWCAVIGITASDEYVIISEFGGSLRALTDVLTEFKDRLLVSRCYLDTIQSESIKQLREHDGLTEYKNLGRSIYGTLRYVNPPETWRYFRDRFTLLRLSPVYDEIKADMLAGYELLRKLKAEGKLVFRVECPITAWVFRQKPPYDKVLKHPLLQALVYAIGMSSKQLKNRDVPAIKTSRIYSNRSR